VKPSLVLICAVLVLASSSAVAHEGFLLQRADVGAESIVFTYEGDLWLVDKDGGTAHRVTRHQGYEGWAKFSPDNKWIAFSASYDGGYDVYVMPATGGEPRRLTFHPSGDRVLGWHPDGEHVLFRSRREHANLLEEVFLISVDGGMPERLAIDRGGLACLSPDGNKLAYNRIPREARTWKRYQGGMAQEIWVADFTTGAIDKITDWPGTDNFPMWHGDAIYFNSDRQDGTLNIYKYDTNTGATTRLTHYRDYDVKRPSIGEGEIVFQYGEQLHLLDVTTGAVQKVAIEIPSDRVRMRPELVSVSPTTGSFGLSPAGERVLIEARGEIANLPAEEGDPVNLTVTSASREKNAAWSPNGKWIAFVSDRTGEEEIYLVDQKGGDWKQLTRGGKGLLMQPVWSPDSKYLCYSDKFMRLNLVEVDGGDHKVIDQSEYDDAWERWGIQDYVWSPDSKWIAYSKQHYNMHESIYLYEVAGGKTTRLTDDMHSDWSPSFAPGGEYLYFLSNRTFNPIMGRQDQNHVFLNVARPYMILLHEDARSPFFADDTVVAVTDDDDDDDGDKDDGDKDDGEDNGDNGGDDGENGDDIRIDLDGIQQRVLAAAGVAAGDYYRLEAIEGGFLYLSRTEPVFLKYQNVNDGTGGSLELMKYDLEEEETSAVLSGIANYHQSADGKKLIYRAGPRYGVVDAGANASVGDGEVDISAVRLRVTRAEEFKQIFDEAWRIQRDWFYDPGMHGVDWQKIHDKYSKLVPYCGTRGDLNYLIGEMIGELNIGHTYIFGGDFADSGPRVGTGLLGAGFAVEPGKDYYRIVNIIDGVPWDPRQRSPLNEPGVPVDEGDYLIAIDGHEVQVGDNVYALLEDKAGRIVTLTVNSKATSTDATDVRVRTVYNEFGLRYRQWVDGNRAKVQQDSRDRIAYVHIPNMGQGGLVEFGRQYYPQTLKEAMIIDVRYNGGGFTGDMIIDRLERELWCITKPREGKTCRDPERVFHGPLVVLINENSGSNAEYFSQAIKLKQLAPIMGVRTWGGAVGIEPHQDMVDGSGTTPPQFGLYGLDGTWQIEGHGVDPDIVVMNLPSDVVAGEDTQLDKAIEFLLDTLATGGDTWHIPPTPEFPNKSKAGEER